MSTIEHTSEEQAAVRSELSAIFVSLELSRSTWLVTSLSPGGGGKMSKHQVRSGDVAGLLARFSQLQVKSKARTGRSYRLIVTHEAGLDWFWIDRTLKNADIFLAPGEPRRGSGFHRDLAPSAARQDGRD